jgi:hypothetical protein
MAGRLLVAALALCAAACTPQRAPESTNGVLDLRSVALDGQPVRLAGDWNAYANQLVSDDPLKSRPEPDLVTPLQIWNGLRTRDGRVVPAEGYAVYQLALRLPVSIKDGASELALRTGEADTAQRLVIRDSDGKLLADVSSGRFGTRAADSVPSQRLRTVRFRTTRDLFVTLYVSNFEKWRGGPWTPPVLGLFDDVETLARVNRTVDFFAIGMIVMIALHYLVMFGMRPRERAPLLFALFCLLMALRAIVTRRYFEDVLPDPHWWSLLTRLNYLSFYCAVPTLALFLRALFPRHAHRSYLVFLLTGCAICIAAVGGPPWLYTRTLIGVQLLTVVSIPWAIYVLVLAARRDRDALPLIMLLGFAVMAASTVFDIVLVAKRHVTGAYFSHFGTVGFVFFQSVLLAMLNDRTRKDLEVRNTEVQRLNESLRQQIGDRSQELQEALLRAAENAPRAELPEGELFAERYRIERSLGSGGMGKVYEAVRVSDGLRVALKVLRGSFKPQAMARFAREAELAARIDHPNVISIHDLDVTSRGELFIAMELVGGESLDAQRARFGDVDWALPLLRQLSGALVAIHSRGILHRDLKPANILVAGGRVKVADFGIAGLKLSSARSGFLRALVDDDTIPEDVKLTQAGAFLGSPLYMAPELVGGAERASSRSDVFSLGLVAYELLSGRPPWEKPIVLERAQGRTPSVPRPLAELVALDTRVAAVFDRCIRIEPAARPDAAEVKATLEELA